MKINLNHIRDDAEKSHVCKDVVIKDINYFADVRNKNKLEGYALKGLILSMKSGNSQQQQLSKQSSSSYNQGNKRQKTAWNGGKPFNRYILIADLANPPHTYAITTSKLNETNRLLQNMFFDSFLGMSFYLVEPDPTRTQHVNHSKILPCEEHDLLPLKWNLELSVPAPIQVPPTVNDTYYFIETSRVIQLHRARVVQQPCCRGYQCDRQKKLDCLCMHTASLSPITYEFDVEFDVNPTDFQGESTHVCIFRSYRTTSVFFKQFEEYSNQTVIKTERDQQTVRRKQIKAMVDYVNNTCGWRIIGWVRRGEISVEGEQERIGNNIVNLRLSYLYPTEDDIFDDPGFIALQIDASNLSDQSGIDGSVET